ncbi:MAG: hypothetical protein ACHQ2Z_06220 [Elusimicrobiota bacterium]
MPEAALRRSLGRFSALWGLALLLPVLFVWLSSGGPAPLNLSARAWSLFFYAHFIVLTVVGFGIQAMAAARSKLFYGGPMIDFLIGVAGFMILESIVGLALSRGGGLSWPALLPGATLIAFGLRLGTGRPLLGS